MITLSIGTNVVQVPVIKFSDGAINVVVPEGEIKSVNFITKNVVEDTAILELVVDVLKTRLLDMDNINLYMPYIPNARADRVFESNNAFPLKVFCEKINSFGFGTVIVLDPHSNVSTNMLKNVSVLTQGQALKQIFPLQPNDVICSPDKGAFEKSSQIAIDNELKMITASKIRDISTGQILSIEIDGDHDLSYNRVIICDDICDGGGTFIPLAKQAKAMGAKEVILFVTHGIFAKGLDIFEDFDSIYCYNIIGNYVTIHDIQKFNLRKIS